MPFDYKKEYKEFYMPKAKPSIVTVPKMNYIAVRGKGDPNEENGEYKNSIGLLYAIAFTIKMSYKGDHKIAGYFEYVVPPLEGFWWQEGIKGMDYAHKEKFQFISVIRLPDFVTKEEFDWAVEEATRKKKTDFSKVEFFTYDEGECVQCMHIGSYDEEPSTVAAMHEYAEANGYVLDITDTRMHHEIYLSDPRRCDVSRLKTVVRHPVRRKEKNLHEKFEFRNIRQDEAEQAAEVEKICFPPNEACSKEMMIQRVEKAPELFLVAIDRATGQVAGFLNGLSTDEDAFRDEFFTDADLYDPKGKNVMLLGLDVLPEYRGQGLARKLVQQYLCREKENGRKKILLTCLEEKVKMYEKFGFQDAGEADSTWGGEKWHEMYCIVN